LINSRRLFNRHNAVTINAVELCNEPWEGFSISGWGADLPRYRELYERRAVGVEEARSEAGVIATTRAQGQSRTEQVVEWQERTPGRPRSRANQVPSYCGPGCRERQDRGEITRSFDMRQIAEWLRFVDATKL